MPRHMLATVSILAVCLAYAGDAASQSSGPSAAQVDATGAQPLTPEQRRAAQRAADAAAREQKRIASERLKGPYKPDIDAFASGRASELQPYYRTLFVEGERNAVLNFNRIGLLELQRNNLPAAKWAFGEAIKRIESIYANDPAAKSAKSIFVEEKIKDFKGEPYERAMSYYYRGLIDLMEGDYQNARASFIAGEFQDTISEREEFEGDFEILNYLAGWASQCDGDSSRSKEFYELAIKANSAVQEPSPDSKLLLIRESGPGPTKVGAGEYKQLLTIKNGTRSDKQTEFSIAPKEGGTEIIRPAVQVTDVSFQASTRGGKPFQSILNGKAEFKGTADAVGGAAITSGLTAMYSDNQSMANLGASMALFGLVAKVAAAAATPAADIRYWDNLPNVIDVAAVPVPNSPYVASARSIGGSTSSQASTMQIAEGRACAIAWTSEKPAAALPVSAPNSAYGRVTDRAILEKDARFRAELLSSLPPAGEQAKPNETSSSVQ